jgi:hypothetical protein
MYHSLITFSPSQYVLYILLQRYTRLSDYIEHQTVPVALNISVWRTAWFQAYSETDGRNHIFTIFIVGRVHD